MKNIKNVGLFLILFLGINRSFASVEETSDISNNAETMTDSLSESNNTQTTNFLSESLRNFKSENPQFDYGIASIADLYHREINIDDFYAPREYHPFVKKTGLTNDLIKRSYILQKKGNREF